MCNAGYNGGIRGADKMSIAATIAITTPGVIRLPVALGTATALNSNGIWLAFAVSNVAGAVIAFVWFRRGTWRGVDLTEGAPGPDPTESPGDD